MQARSVFGEPARRVHGKPGNAGKRKNGLAPGGRPPLVSASLVGRDGPFARHSGGNLPGMSRNRRERTRRRRDDFHGG